MKKKYLIISSLCLLLSGSIGAQVTIGSGILPASGALLDLKERDATTLDPTTANKGLGLPRVVLTSPSNLFPMFAKADGTATTEYAADKAGTKTINKSHIGLIVYNSNQQETTNRLCPGLHVWDGDKWQPLTPYPTIDPAKTIISKNITAEASRIDITGTAGYAIGPLGRFTDTRGPAGNIETNQYHHARFYAHKVQATGDVTYRGIRNTNVCDASQTVVDDWTETGATFEYIDDGVWMTENMNTKYQTADATVIIVAHVMGGGQASNSDPNPQYATPANTSANTTQITQNGLFYNWAAATNQKGGSTGQLNEDGKLSEPNGLHKERQGICPTGWHLPSDKEYNELEATYAPSSSNFTLSPTMAFDWSTSYNTLQNWRPNTENDLGHGKSMKSTTPLNDTPTNGDSKTANNGGFNFLLAGEGHNGLANNFGMNGYLWSSSSSSGTSAWSRVVSSVKAGVYLHAYYRYYLFSVRCKKNDN